MSGNICAATNSPSPCSKATTISSTNPAPHGTSSPTIPNASPQSNPELGRRSILEAVGISHRGAPDSNPDPVNPFVLENGIGQVSLMCRAGGRRDGTASTTTHSASIANPMNSNTNTSTAIPQQTDRFVGKQLTVS